MTRALTPPAGPWPNGWLGAPGTRWLARRRRGGQHRWEGRGRWSAAAPWRTRFGGSGIKDPATEGRKWHEERPTPPGSGETQPFGHYTRDAHEALRESSPGSPEGRAADIYDRDPHRDLEDALSPPEEGAITKLRASLLP